MPVIARSPEGKVVALWGTALIRGIDGQLRALKVGDLVRKGDQILTTQNGIVQIGNGDEAPPAAQAKASEDNEVDRAISELNSGDRLAAPAAGLSGGDGGSLEAALRVDRIAEPLSAGVLPRSADEATVQTQFDATGTTVAEPDAAPGLPALGAPSSAISAAEEGSTTNLGLAAPTGPAAGGSIRVGQVPAVGEIHKADGTLVTAGTVLTPADLPGLVYTPPADYDGVAPVGNFSYTLTADGQTVTGGTSINLVAVNDRPVATPALATGNEDGSLPVSLGGTDVDGRIVGVTVTSIPAGATLRLADGVTPVQAGQTLTPEQAATLLFRPAADFFGDQTLLFTVTDNGGAVSAPAAVSLTVVAVNDLPVPGAGSGGSGTEDSPVAVRLGGTDVDGSVTAVTVTTLPANGTLFLADGVTPVAAGSPLTPAQATNLVFVPNPDFNGNVTIGFTVTDSDGATSTPSSAVVTVAPVNDAPVARADSASFAEDSVATGNVLANDSDVDGPALSVASFVFGGVSFQAGSTAIVGGVGTLVINIDGSWSFTPAANFNGPVPAIQVTTTDGSLSATSTLTLTVTPVNDAPLAQADIASTPINTPTTIAVLANDSDVEGQALTVTGASLANPAQGSVTVNPDGSLGFTPTLNFTGTATITYTVRDASGASSTATVTVNVGNNTAPDGTDVTRSLPEDGSYAVQAGDFGFSDADAGQTLANVRIDSLPAAGALLLNGVPVTAGTVVSLAQLAAGELVFAPANNGNGAPYASFGFSVQDSSGGFDTTPNTFRFDVTPVNDAPVAAVDTASTNEDTALTLTPATLLANDSDVDGDALGISSVQGAVNGTVALVGGNVVFTPAANYNGPASFTYTVIDGNGGSSTATVNLTINAVGDPAVISSGAGSVTEDVGVSGGNLSTGGTLTITDPDAGEASFQAQSVNGAYGSFTLGADGVWAYTASNANPAIQALGVGNTLTETFTVRSVDGTTSTVVVTIKGTNDASVISAGTGSVTEDVGVVGGNIATGGTLTVTDVDASQSSFQAQASTAGTYGTFTLGTDGAWTYTASNTNPAVQALGVGQTLTETFTVRSTDGTTSTVVVTINGTNDAAVISAGTGSVTEDVGVVGGNISTGGTLTVTDVDSGQAAFQAQASTAGAYGTFTLGTDGVWTYTASNSNPAVQALGAGQTLTETFTVRSTDGTTSTVVVTINGTNDAAVISAGTGSVTEDVGVVGGNISTGGTLTVTDVDSGQAAFQAQASTAGAYGTFTLGTDGAWTYTALNTNPAVQALGAGQTLTETFTVRSTDGTTSTVVVTINGTNDSAVISAGIGSVTEDVGVVGGNISTGGTLTVTDVDSGQAAFQAQASTAGAYGTFTLGTDGAWTYTALNTNPAVQALGAGQTLTETFTVRSTDGTTSTVVVTINGTNDAAVISAGTGAVTEDVGVVGGNIATGGTLTVTDVDSGQSAFQAQASTAGTYGTFTLSTNGVWTYTASSTNPAVQALGAGQTLTETFTVRSTDGTTSTVVVTINGTNDAAVISAGTGSVTEDVAVTGGNISTGGTLTVTDVDSGQASFQAQASTAGSYGTFTLGTDGAWTYTALNSNPAVQALGVGQTLTETFTVRSTDGTISSVIVTINGTNDGPVAQANALSTDEDTALTIAPATLLANDGDVDGDTLTIASVQDAVNGTVALVGGNVVFTPAANYNGPASFTYTVSDGHGGTSTATVSLMINAVNDAPTANADTASTAINTALPSIAVLANDTDVDGDTLTVTSATLANPALGTVSINPDGTLAFTPALNVAGVVAINYTISDGHGGTSSATLSVNVGANTPPTGTDVTITIAEDGSHSFTAADFGFTDADLGQTLAAVRIETLPAAGALTLGGVAVVAGQVINAADFGQLAYTPTPNANGNGYAGFTFSVQDSAGAFDTLPNSVTVNVTPVPDVAVISGVASGTTVEDTTVTTGGQLLVNDPDAGEAAFQPQVNAAGAYGSLSIDASGAWTYTLNNADPVVQSLAQGETRTETFTVRSIDGTPQQITITVTGTNDTAVISAGTGSVTEDVGVIGGNIATGGTLTVTDVDSGQASFQAQASTAGAYGTFTLGTNGAWTYTALNSNPAVQALGAGQTLTETFTVRSTDGTTSTVVVTINGTNDAAVISAGTGSVTEDVGVVGGNIATGGTLTVTDVDSGQASFQAQASTAGAYGTFTLGTDGAWTYTALNSNPAVQALGAGQTLTETFTVRSTDGTTSAVVVIINGTNDAAVISAGTGSVTEDVGVVGGNISTGGTLAVTDVDSGQASFQAQTSTAGTYGTFTLGTNGVWTYTALDSNPAVQALGAGQTLTETFTVRSTDGTTSTVVVTINGTNDAAVISAGTGSVTEDVGVVGGNIATGGTLTVTDVDSGQASFQAQASTAGTYGTFTIGNDGTWTYTALNSNPAVQALGAGQTLTETFTVRSTDGTTSTVVVTINGTNDAAVISAGAGSVTEDVGVVGGNIATGGTLTVTDVDSGQASFQAQASTAGAYGTFTLGTDGVWTYTALNSNPAVQALGAGQTLTETFTVRSTDGTTSTVVVTINGTNDAAVISAGTGSVTEDVGVVGGNIATGGTLTVTDVDSGQASFQAQASTAGAYGTFTLGANGAWTYAALNSNPAVQALGAGQTLTETFTVRSTDGTTSTVVVTINGTNDAAVISAGTGSVTEDVAVTGGNISTGGTLTVTDVDAGQASFQAQASTAGTYGTFTLGTDGAWTYTALNSNPAVQALGAGQTLTETFTVRSTDGTASTVVVTINGTNDAAVISAGAGSVTEDVGVVGGNIATGGTLTVTDVDSGQASFQAQASTAGAYGTFTLGTDGAWTYTALNSNPAVQALGVGQTLTETFTVRSTDGTTSTVVVTINGTNDAAVISAGTGAVTEDVGVVGGNIATGGTLTVTDVDSGQASFQAQASTAGTYGTFTLGTNGAWTYTALNSNPAVQALGAGQTLTETFTVRSTDGTASTVVVTINGTNDAAVISAGTGSVTEDVGVVGGNIATGGTLTVTDVDSGQASFQAQASTAGAYGTFTLGANGAWTYTALNSNPVVQALGAGQTLTETFTVRSTDGTTSTVVVTINGTNDAAVISAGTGSVTEDVGVVGGNIATGGTLTVTDVDSGQTSFQAQTSTAGTYGTFTLGANGVWTYTALNSNPAVQALGAGQTLTETFTVRSTDGTTSTVVVTINGTNDAAVISAGTGSVTEDVGVVGGNIATGGTLTVTDVDSGQTSFQAQASTAGAYGTFTLGTNGTWSYTASNSNPSVQALGAGQTLTETFTVRSTDGTTSTVVVTINGTNDAAVISAGTGSVTEDVGVAGGNISTGGTLTVTDVDAGQASFQAQASTAGTYGTFTLGTDGAWTYTALNSNPAVQALGVGQTLTETFTVRSTDGTTSTVVVTINGTNDAAVISAGTGAVTEDVGVVGGTIVTGGTLTVTDVDAGQASFQAQASTAGAYGTFTLGTDGTWTYTASNSNPAVQALGAGQTLTETFTVRSTDGTTSTVVVTINGTNDAAVISAGTGAVTEDVGVVGGTIVTGGTLTVTDVDAGQASFQAQASTAGAYGTFTLGTDGTWTYTASNSNPAVQALGAGQTLTETFTVRSTDGTTSTVVVTINGTNDAAVISAGTGSVTEDVGVVGGNISTGGTLTVTDVDAGQASFQAQASTAGSYGTFTLGTNGAWTYTASNSNPAVQALGAGQTLTETFTVRSTDGTTSTVVVTINGTNDAAVISAGTGSVTEDVGVLGGNIATGGTLTVTDIDAGQASFQAQASTAGTYGTFTLGTNGAWTYTALNSNPAVQALGAGQTLTETFTVRSTDGTTSTVVVTINGTNDAAVISAGTGSVTEDVGVLGGNISTGGTLTVTDVDSGQASFQAHASTAGTYGTFTLGTNGAWTYTALNSNPAVQALGAGQTLTETFTVRSTDGTASTVVVTINGTNDAAVISAGTGSVTEDVAVTGGNISTGGTLTVTDVDAGQASFQAQASTAGTYGTFTLGTDGAWTYTALNSNPAVQALGVGQTLTETFTVRSTDGTTSAVVVIINGTNDAAVISAGTGSVTEDVGVVGGNISTGGTLTVTDVDSAQAAFQAQASTAGAYGTFTLGTDGAWTYTASNANPAVQALGAGQTLTETFTVRSTDGTTSTVVVTIKGANDAAVISAGTGSVTEDVGVVGGNIATGGTLTVTDVDAGQASFQAQASTAGAYGTFTLGTNGAWTYTALNSNPVVQALGVGQTLTETFTVRSTDGTTSTVVVTINGTNDAAVISAGTGSVTEDVGVVGGNIATGGTLTVTDVDSAQAAFQAQASTAGAYGTFTLGTNGTWSYTASNSNPSVQALGAGQTLTETFTVRSTDGTTSTVDVTINGTNDAAVISAGTGSVTEDVGVVGGNIATGGTLTVTDVDSGQASFQAHASTAGTYGTFTLGTNGAWTYTALNSNPAVQALGAGQTLTETFTVRSTDGTASTVVVTINGTNDAAVISAGTGAVTEDVGVVGGNIAAGGTLTVTDADSGQAAFQPQASTAGAYGTFTLGANGAWTYTALNSNPAVQALGVGQTLTETFTVRSTDGTASTVVVTINGTNDAAVISAGTGSVTEDVGVIGGNIATGGTLTVTDVDSGQASFQAQGSTAGTYGTFTLGTNGVWTYTALNSNPAVQALGAGQTLTETFTVRSTDGTTSTVVVTINGTNDAAVISAGTGSVTEDVGVVGGNISTGGTLTVTDVDAGQASFQAQASTAGAYGTFTLGTNGAWTYTALNSNPAVQALGAGQTLTETFTVRSTDGTASTVVVTINGTDDAAVISAGTGAVTEDVGVLGGNIATGGTLTVTDVDSGQASFQAQASTAGTYGTFTLGTNGAWTYTALNSNPAVQALGAGQTLTETFTVRSTDGTTSTVVVTINGTNDAAVISAGTGSVTEDVGVVGGNIATGGTLTVTDVDSGQASFQAQASTAGAYGTLTLGTDGAWTYTALNSNPAVQALGVGQTLTETFTVRSTDGTTSTVVVTINGTNDAAVISAGTGSVTEDVAVTGGNISTGGTLTVTDVDAGQASFQAQASTAGTYGTFTLGTNGVWTYTALNSNPAVQALGTGQTLTETFTVRSTDGTTSTVVVTIIGTNDAAVISAGTGSVTEDVAVTGGNISTGGTLTVTDVDAGQASFQAQASTAGTYGTFTLGGNGVWTYTASNSNPAVQALGAGQTLTETFTVRSTDGTTSTVVVTINGTNDAPVAQVSSFTVAEDAAIVNGAVTATDIDIGATRTFALTGAAPAGLTFNSDGTYSFNPANAAYQSLAAGQTQTITVPYTVTDNAGATSTANLIITVTGVNDAPTIGGPLTGTVREDTTLTATGTLTITDADAGQSSFVARTAVAGTYGSFSITTGGVWTYTLANSAANVQALPAGSSVNDSFVVTSADGTPRTVVVTVNGINDAPVAQAASFSVAEDAAIVNGSVTATDVDTGSTLSFALNGVAPAGLSFNSNGTYSFNPANAAYQSLAVGQSQVITVPYTVTDNTGATSTANLVITVNGTNDAPVANVNTVAATEDVALTIAPATLLANDTDVDGGDVLSIASVQGAVGGTVSLVGGNIVFTPTANFSGTGSFTYTVSDGHGGTSTASVNVNVAAVADAPTLVIDTATSTSGTVTNPVLPPSTGLTRAFYDNIGSVDTSNAGSISAVEAAVETSTATSTSVVTNVAIPTVGVDDAYRYTGYIFLEAGKTYTVSGSRDDTLMVKLGGTQVYGVGFNNWGSFTATSFTPAASGYYSLEITAYNGDGAGDLDINMSVNGAAAVDLSTANFSLYANASAFAGSTVNGPLVPNNDGGYFPAVYKVGNEDTAIRLGSIGASLVDTDGSETLSVSVGSIPTGAVLSDGTNSFTASAGSTSVNVTGWALNNLTLTPPAHFSGTISLNVSATATEAAGGSATTQSPLVVVVTPTVDAPVIAGDTTIVTMAQGSGGQSTVNLPVLATLVDTDGSETLSVAISGVPTGASFNHGTSTGNGVWTFSAADLADLTLTLPAGYSTTGAPLTVTVASTETATGSSDSVSSTITLIADYTTSTTGGANNNANTLSGSGGNNLIDGLGGDDNISGNAGNDYIIGGSGADTLNGGTGNDVLLGGIGNDIIIGGTGSDLIRGGAGNDTLTGGATPGAADGTADVFAWSLADAGTAGARATDTITDFNVGAVSAGGDVLDLRDLLSGDVVGAGNTAGNLINFMEFEVSTTGGVTSTTIHISSTGQFAGGVYVPGQEDQSIVLQGVNLPTALGLGAGATDSQILQELLTRGKLIVDSAP